MKPAVRTISIAEDFSRYPGGRFRADGEYSGEAFRDDLLAGAIREALAANTRVVVDLDGATGYPSSFLEEAFGGLVRKNVFTRKELDQVLTIRASKVFDTYAALARRYIQQASPTRH